MDLDSNELAMIADSESKMRQESGHDFQLSLSPQHIGEIFVNSNVLAAVLPLRKFQIVQKPPGYIEELRVVRMELDPISKKVKSFLESTDQFLPNRQPQCKTYLKPSQTAKMNLLSSYVIHLE